MTPWLLALLPALLQPLIFWGYRRTLGSKREEVKLLISESAKPLYQSAFRRQPGELFQWLYGDALYAIPLLIHTVLVLLAAIVLLARAGWPPAGIPAAVVEKFADTPAVAIAGVVGAFVWGLWDSVRRAQLASLTPSALQFVWLRLLIGATFVPLFAMTVLADSLQILFAFCAAALPIATFVEYAERFALRHVGMEALSKFEGPTVQHLQGFTKEVVEDLASAGISSTQHLAHADPVTLLMRTNLSWKVILDLIDQALLFNYVGEKIPVFRQAGIRGSVEMASVGQSLESDDPAIQLRGSELIRLLATGTDSKDEFIKNVIQTVMTDRQVLLVAELWGTNFRPPKE